MDISSGLGDEELLWLTLGGVVSSCQFPLSLIILYYNLYGHTKVAMSNTDSDTTVFLSSRN